MADTTQTVTTTTLERGVSVRLTEGAMSDVIDVARLSDDRVVLTISMGIDGTDTDNPDWPTEGFAEIVLPAMAWEALRNLGA
jgi:hypothetical protein